MARSTATLEARPPLSKERVLGAAVRLADQDGIASLSMRKLAQDLGVEAMSLYNHVRNKDDLLDGMTDVVVGEIDVRSRRDHWRLALRRQVLAARAVMLRHPWAPRVIESRRTMSPILVGYMESVMRIVREGGFSVDQTHHILHVLGSRILGFNQDLFEDTGSLDTSPEIAAIMAREMAAKYPYVTEMAMSVSHNGGLGGCDDDVEFAFGLDLILDGLERMLNADPADRTAAVRGGSANRARARAPRPSKEPDPGVARAVADLRTAALHATDRELQRQLRKTLVNLLDSALQTPAR